jgi:hypothetical protein
MRLKLFKFFVLVLIILFSGIVNALTLNVNSKVLKKGENLLIEGECDLNGQVNIIASNNERMIFNKFVDCSFNSFNYSHFIDFTDPSGAWTIKAIEKTNEKKISVRILHSKESKLLNIEFLSPSSGKHFRGENVSLSVKVLNAGKGFDDAVVFFWDLHGEKHQMENKGKGVFTAGFKIPLNAPLESKKIVVVVKSFDGLLGGEEELEIEIEKAIIVLEILKPTLKNFDVGSFIGFKVRAVYNNGEALDGGRVLIKVNEREIELKNESKELFEGGFTPKEEDLGSLTVKIIAKDAFNNSSEKEVLIVVREKIPKELINLVLYITFIVVLLIVGWIFFSKYKKNAELNKKKFEEKRVIQKLISELKKDYYDKGIIDKKTFKEKMLEYNERLRKLEEN